MPVNTQSLMTTSDIRRAFIEFFKSQTHEPIQSSSLVPSNDPTLLFTNAGMVQFKDVFLGRETPGYTRAVSSQRCVRAGGKHNDLENVGYTARHHTFFEMMGNFSFGDYFKKEAIRFAWTFLTETLGLPAERLWVTVYNDDKESENIWFNDIGIDQTRFSRCGDKDNFWSMGDTGPCGPCTEIFYDHGPDVAGGPPGSPDEDGDRYVEIWNVVFMQFNRDASGKKTPLPKPCVDTGMGLERVAAVMQGVHSNYEIDLFQSLLKALSDLSGCTHLLDHSMCAVVDHIRSSAFLICDGVVPSNEGRGYVLRRIIRRAIRHGYKTGIQDTFFYKLVAPLVDEMGEAYPELKKAQSMIESLLEQEEQQFALTLSKGLKILEQSIQSLDGDTIPGAVVFQLYDTFGFPPDLTADVARERHLQIDHDGFDVLMQQQRDQSGRHNAFSMDYTQELLIDDVSDFSGYKTETDQGRVTTLLTDGKPVSTLSEGESGVIVLDRTPFYAESGGQVGDKGYLKTDTTTFRVYDTKKTANAILHVGEIKKGAVSIGDEMHGEVGPGRTGTRANHSATHLLHEALRRVLGDHVHQKGSLVDPTHLRFDFSHTKPLTRDQLIEIERLVNEQIRLNYPVEVINTTIEEAKGMGALALFGEKYGNDVRVLKMGGFSIELCGGTHVNRTGDIGFFKIVTESATAAGVRRIEAVSGEAALLWVEENEQLVLHCADLLKSTREDMVDRILSLFEKHKELEKSLQSFKQHSASQQGAQLINQAQDINGIQVIAAEFDQVDRDTLRNTFDSLKQHFDRFAIVLASRANGRAHLLAGVSTSCLPHFKAADLLNHVAHQINGKGGGRPELAEGGGDNLTHLKKALDSVPNWIVQMIGRVPQA